VFDVSKDRSVSNFGAKSEFNTTITNDHRLLWAQQTRHKTEDVDHQLRVYLQLPRDNTMGFEFL